MAWAQHEDVVWLHVHVGHMVVDMALLQRLRQLLEELNLAGEGQAEEALLGFPICVSPAQQNTQLLLSEAFPCRSYRLKAKRCS